MRGLNLLRQYLATLDPGSIPAVIIKMFVPVLQVHNRYIEEFSIIKQQAQPYFSKPDGIKKLEDLEELEEHAVAAKTWSEKADTRKITNPVKKIDSNLRNKLLRATEQILTISPPLQPGEVDKTELLTSEDLQLLQTYFIFDYLSFLILPEEEKLQFKKALITLIKVDEPFDKTFALEKISELAAATDLLVRHGLQYGLEPVKKKYGFFLENADALIPATLEAFEETFNHIPENLFRELLEYTRILATWLDDVSELGKIPEMNIALGTSSYYLTNFLITPFGNKTERLLKEALDQSERITFAKMSQDFSWAAPRTISFQNFLAGKIYSYYLKSQGATLSDTEEYFHDKVSSLKHITQKFSDPELCSHLVSFLKDELTYSVMGDKEKKDELTYPVIDDEGKKVLFIFLLLANPQEQTEYFRTMHMQIMRQRRISTEKTFTNKLLQPESDICDLTYFLQLHGKLGQTNNLLTRAPGNPSIIDTLISAVEQVIDTLMLEVKDNIEKGRKDSQTSLAHNSLRRLIICLEKFHLLKIFKENSAILSVHKAAISTSLAAHLKKLAKPESPHQYLIDCIKLYVSSDYHNNNPLARDELKESILDHIIKEDVKSLDLAQKLFETILKEISLENLTQIENCHIVLNEIVKVAKGCFLDQQQEYSFRPLLRFYINPQYSTDDIDQYITGVKSVHLLTVLLRLTLLQLSQGRNSKTYNNDMHVLRKIALSIVDIAKKTDKNSNNNFTPFLHYLVMPGPTKSYNRLANKIIEDVILLDVDDLNSFIHLFKNALSISDAPRKIIMQHLASIKKLDKETLPADPAPLITSDNILLFKFYVFNDPEAELEEVEHALIQGRVNKYIREIASADELKTLLLVTFNKINPNSEKSAAAFKQLIDTICQQILEIAKTNPDILFELFINYFLAPSSIDIKSKTLLFAQDILSSSIIAIDDLNLAINFVQLLLDPESILKPDNRYQDIQYNAPSIKAWRQSLLEGITRHFTLTETFKSEATQLPIRQHLPIIRFFIFNNYEIQLAEDTYQDLREGIRDYIDKFKSFDDLKELLKLTLEQIPENQNTYNSRFELLKIITSAIDKPTWTEEAIKCFSQEVELQTKLYEDTHFPTYLDNALFMKEAEIRLALWGLVAREEEISQGLRGFLFPIISSTEEDDEHYLIDIYLSGKMLSELNHRIFRTTFNKYVMTLSFTKIFMVFRLLSEIIDNELIDPIQNPYYLELTSNLAKSFPVACFKEIKMEAEEQKRKKEKNAELFSKLKELREDFPDIFASFISIIASNVDTHTQIILGYIFTLLHLPPKTDEIELKRALLESNDFNLNEFLSILDTQSILYIREKITISVTEDLEDNYLKLHRMLQMFSEAFKPARSSEKNLFKSPLPKELEQLPKVTIKEFNSYSEHDLFDYIHFMALDTLQRQANYTKVFPILNQAVLKTRNLKLLLLLIKYYIQIGDYALSEDLFTKYQEAKFEPQKWISDLKAIIILIDQRSIKVTTDDEFKTLFQFTDRVLHLIFTTKDRLKYTLENINEINRHLLSLIKRISHPAPLIALFKYGLGLSLFETVDSALKEFIKNWKEKFSPYGMTIIVELLKRHFVKSSAPKRFYSESKYNTGLFDLFSKSLKLGYFDEATFICSSQGFSDILNKSLDIDNFQTLLFQLDQHHLTYWENNIIIQKINKLVDLFFLCYDSNKNLLTDFIKSIEPGYITFPYLLYCLFKQCIHDGKLDEAFKLLDFTVKENEKDLHIVTTYIHMAMSPRNIDKLQQEILKHSQQRKEVLTEFLNKMYVQNQHLQMKMYKYHQSSSSSVKFFTPTKQLAKHPSHTTPPEGLSTESSPTHIFFRDLQRQAFSEPSSPTAGPYDPDMCRSHSTATVTSTSSFSPAHTGEPPPGESHLQLRSGSAPHPALNIYRSPS